jgi:hypothetical protein
MQKAKIDDEHIGGADQSKAKIGYEHVHFGPDHIESADTIKNLIQTWFLLMPFRGAYSFAFSLSHTLERPPPAHPAQSVRAPHTQIQTSSHMRESELKRTTGIRNQTSGSRREAQAEEKQNYYIMHL